MYNQKIQSTFASGEFGNTYHHRLFSVADIRENQAVLRSKKWIGVIVGPPDYRDAEFKLDHSKVIQNIEMNYLF